MHLLFYNIFLRLYALGVWFASFFNQKAADWRKGRRNTFPKLNKFLRDYPRGKRVWFHCASLGEFEQARPVIEALKQIEPDTKIILTFFSPSGYQIRREFPLADLVCYLPHDTATDAKAIVRKLKPDFVFWVKYEFWFHTLRAIHKHGIPFVLFAANFRQEQLFFHPQRGHLHRKMLSFFTHIFVQNESSKKLLETINVHSEVARDTRFDRVASIAMERKQFETIQAFKCDRKILVAGSVWLKDAELIAAIINQNILPGWRYIIAPHNIGKDDLNEVISLLDVKKALLSRLHKGNVNDYEVLLVDTIGSLASIYAYGDVAYVGGGFNASVHNVLEPAVYGLPVIFAPNFTKSAEAQTMLKMGSAFCVKNEEDLRNILLQKEALEQAGLKNKSFVEENLGGTAVVMEAFNTK